MSLCSLKICRLILCGIVGCCLAAPLQTVSARPQEAKAQAGQPTMEQMMAEYEKAGAPGPEHERIKELAGNWKTVTKSFMAPGAEPMVSEGTSKVSLIHGGRFAMEEFKGSLMNKPFQGLGLTGYDKAKKQYVSSWTDSMSTAIMMMHGSYDAATKELQMTGSYDDPLTKQTKKFRTVGKMIDPDKHVFSMYEEAEGKEALSMEITYTRQ